MTSSGGDGVPPSNRVELQQLVIRLGVAMVAAGDAVQVIEGSLRQVVVAYGVRDIQIALLPTSLFVETGAGESAHVQFISQVVPPLRLDQIGALYELARSLERGQLTIPEGLKALDGVYHLQPTFGWSVRTVGHAVLTAGLALLLEPTPAGFAAAFVLGLVVGLLKLLELPGLGLVLPTVTSFAVAAAVFATAPYLHIDNPIRLLVAPLVTFLPGGVLAIGTIELAAGQVVSGSSRLVSGFVQLALLAFGILAAAQLIGASGAELVDHKVAGLGAWAAWCGVLVFALGTYLYFSAPVRSLPWMLFILLVTFAAQSIGDSLFGGQLSGFFGAVVMTPLVLWVEKLPHGPPKLVTFLPAFWLLVPGATGLIGVAQIVGTGAATGTRAFTDVLVSIMAIALGVLAGASAYQAAGSVFVPSPKVRH